MTVTTAEQYQCSIDAADRILDWILNRGGVLVWKSVDLSCPGSSWSTPAQAEDGKPVTKPTWRAENEPSRHITDIDEVEVMVDKEVKRFYVAVRPGSQGLMLKCTDGATRRIRAAVAKAGEYAYHTFDYETQEAVIMAPDRVIPLREYAEEKGVSCPTS